LHREEQRFIDNITSDDKLSALPTLTLCVSFGETQFKLTKLCKDLEMENVTTLTAPSAPEVVSTQPLVCIRNLSKIFYSDELETRAVSDLDLNIDRGEYVAISGPSGSGKSTLLSIIGLLDSPTEGEYLLAGELVNELSRSERARLRGQHIGFIFQAFNLIGSLTVQANVERPMTFRKMPADERRRRAAEALERVGMSHRAKHYPSQLSGGQQQRVAVARAVAGSPSLLLADEPTGNLDSANGEKVMDLLRELHQGGATVCMVTHDPRYARYADRTVHMLDGRLA
jgi:putative ABC transport system ATP-binding protein